MVPPLTGNKKKKKKKQPRMIYPELQIRQYIMQVQN